MVLKNKLFLQLIRFGIVGVTAACVQIGIVALLVEAGALTPLLANIAAFLFAFQVSYWGHRYWTFAAINQHRVAIPRLLIVSTSIFAANESLFYLLLTYLHLQYLLALSIVVFSLPIITFCLSKLWVFRTE